MTPPHSPAAGGPALGLGLVGAGAFGGYVLDALAGLSGVRVAAVADPDPARARALAVRHGAEPVGSLEELTARQDVQAVALATPPATHADMAVAALRAGRHVFCEKPLAMTAADARRVGREAERSGRVLVVDHVLRYNPLLTMVQRLGSTAGGERLLDPLRRFSFENDASDQDLGPGHWFWDEEHSGGIFIEHGVHFFDTARALFGSTPETVQGTAVARADDGPVDMVVATAVHPGGATATHTHSFTHASRCERQLMRLDFGFAEARISGWIPTRAVISAWVGEEHARLWETLPDRAGDLLAVPGFVPHGDERVTVQVRRNAGGAEPVRGRGVSRSVPHRVEAVVDLGGHARKPYVYTQSVRAAFADLLHCARTGAPPVAGADSGVAAVAVAEAATLSARSGRTERVEVDGP